MGAVYEAVHTQIGRRVAIKVLHPEFSKNQEILNRFFNEARAVNIIGHPSLVDVHEFGKREDGCAYLVMQLLEGDSLKKRLAKSGGKLGSSALLMARQIATALSAAHAKGIVHRDLKPENIMLVPDPEAHGGERVKVLDFGIAKLSGVANPAVTKTKTGTVMGTPLYMSPEQCRGLSDIGAGSDVYSLGVMLYEALAGRPPFVSEYSGELLGSHLFQTPPVLHTLAPEVSPHLSALVHRMLSKEPQKRPTMSEVARLLEEDGSLVVRASHGWLRSRLLLGLIATALIVAGGGVLMHLKSPVGASFLRGQPQDLGGAAESIRSGTPGPSGLRDLSAPLDLASMEQTAEAPAQRESGPSQRKPATRTKGNKLLGNKTNTSSGTAEAAASTPATPQGTPKLRFKDVPVISD